ncbi:MAG: thrombospondin [Nitrosopumilus sp.]|nr:thrombospondin [Nitrosopumilus sp.]MDH3341343.1 thrombospondin [Nitrosopumilus sp.]
MDADDDDPTLPSEDLATKYLQDIQDCSIIASSSSRHLCYSLFFGKVAENEENNLDALELSIALSKIGAIDDCHFVSHEIGHVAFEKNPDVISNLIGMDGSMCRGGYFHGVLASYFHNIEENNETSPSDFNLICDDLIGSSNYQDCVHGLGHGLVHYFGDDLNSSLNLCHEMSFYQNILCVKGVMMQYSDNVLTVKGISKDVVSDICNQSQLDKLDFMECSMSVGTTLSFFNNHDYDASTKYCEFIENKVGKDHCLEGLRLEIADSEKYKIKPLTEDIREKFQPQFESDYIIDIRSPAVISNFEQVKEIEMISFSIDSPQYVIMYIPSEFISSKILVTVNNQIPRDLAIKDNILGEEITMISFTPHDAGIVFISTLPWLENYVKISI